MENPRLSGSIIQELSESSNEIISITKSLSCDSTWSGSIMQEIAESSDEILCITKSLSCVDLTTALQSSMEQQRHSLSANYSFEESNNNLLRRSRSFDGSSDNGSLCEPAKNSKKRLSMMSNMKKKNRMLKTRTLEDLSSKYADFPISFSRLINDGGVKRKRDFDETSKNSAALVHPSLLINGTIVPKQSAALNKASEFVKPKTYECGFCIKDYNQRYRYLKHIRNHVITPRCAGCNKSFYDIVARNWHQLKCFRRAIL